MDITFIKSRSQELDVPKDDPFKNDKLGRSKLCDLLTDIISFYGQSGCVMSLNGEWGVGKTTFVRMWRQYLLNNGFKTLYFNAWTSDYSNDALMSIVNELGEIAPQNPTLNKIAGYGSRLVLALIKGMARKTLGIEFQDLEGVSSEIVEIGKESIRKFQEQKKTVEEFKRLIVEFVAQNAGDHPVVFFIDELDRCNPHCAVSVLERVKHLFDIPNIIFIMAINKVALGSAIHGYFGSESIDSNEYLRRFIDIEYTLPQPKIENYCKYLYEEYGFNQFFKNPIREKCFSEYREDEEFISITYSLCSGSNANLRQIDRVFAYARLALTQLGERTYLIPGVYFMLCFWKVLNPAFYENIRLAKYSIQGLVDDLEKYIPVEKLRSVNRYDNHEMISSIACLVYCYDVTITLKNQHSNMYLKLNEKDGRKISPLTTNHINKDNLDELLDYYYNRSTERNRRGLGYIFDRIDLLIGLR